MKNKSNYIFLGILIFVLLSICLLSLALGEYDLSLTALFNGLMGSGSETDLNIIWNVRIPRIVVGMCVGATLTVSGLFTKIALRNPLADSGILGIQTGATTFALVVLLLFPFLYDFLPIFAFIGGILAFAVVIGISYRSGLNSVNLILAGVAVNAFFAAIIGILSIFNPVKLQNTLTYLNGSLASVTAYNMEIILIYSSVLLLGAFLFLPMLKILFLSDITISNLGKKPGLYRFLISFYAVLLASITTSYVGVISFIGILVPNIVNLLIRTTLRWQVIFSILLGGIVIVGSDLFQRIVAAPREIPVGLVIGLISAPIFLFILKRNTL